ncbi:GspH/FimT family pseudopilin [Kaarinaea lacus]
MFRGEKQQGLTLIELMVALAIAMIVIALSTPLSNLFQQNRVISLEHEFVTSLNLARSAAVSTAAPATVCRADTVNPNICAPPVPGPWEQGWIVFEDPNNNCTIDAGEPVLQQHTALTPGYTLREPAIGCITYNRTGFTPAAAGTWSLCDPNRDPQFQRAVNLNVTGRVNLLTPPQIVAAGIACPPPPP